MIAEEPMDPGDTLVLVVVVRKGKDSNLDDLGKSFLLLERT